MRTADCEGGRKTREKEEEEEEEAAVADLGDTLTEKGWKLRRDVQFFFCSLLCTGSKSRLAENIRCTTFSGISVNCPPQDGNFEFFYGE